MSSARLLTLAMAMLAPPAFAEVPLPPERPQSVETEDVVPLPRSRPERPPALTGDTNRTDADSPLHIDTELDACVAQLRSRNVAMEIRTPIEEPPCAVASPLEVSAIGPIALTPSAILTCRTAAAVADWLEDIVLPEATRIGAELAGLRVAASYVCRTRNNQPDAQISEHGHARALDIAEFEFVSRGPIAVRPYDDVSDVDMRFLDRVRSGACYHVTTVLGPGSDGYHQDHLHLDIARRGRSGEHRLCR